MKNKEKYAKEIINIACSGAYLAVDKSTKHPVRCDKNIECCDCLFYTGCNDPCSNPIKWANSEA